MPETLSPIERVVRALRRLPGVGEKTATRLAYFLTAAPEDFALELGEALEDGRQRAARLAGADHVDVEVREVLRMAGETVGQRLAALENADDVEDREDNCPDVPNPNNINLDCDIPEAQCDDLGDACDPDDDGDGICDPGESDASCTGSDNCAVVYNPGQEDSDGDGYGDACEGDRDGDGVEDTADNCPDDANPNQEDLDSDGTGDACDADIDGDSVDNTSDNCPNTPNLGQEDLDSDGLGDACDDSDGDGVVDAIDNCPLVANADQADYDGDGLGDACDNFTDSDNDGFEDSIELYLGTDALDACGYTYDIWEKMSYPEDGPDATVMGYYDAVIFFTGEAWTQIPRHRYLGNAFLSLLTKIASGYWHVADSQTGYTAISREALETLPLDKLYKRYGYPIANSEGEK